MRSTEDLEAAASTDDVSAQIELARQLHAEGRGDAALEWLRRAAGSGDAAARYALSWHLLGPPSTDAKLAEGAELAFSAARDGNGEAAYLAAKLVGFGYVAPPDWAAMLSYLQRAAELGCEQAQAELRGLSNDPELAARAAEGQAQSKDLWPQLTSSIDLSQWLAAPRPRVLNINPRIGVVEGLVSPEFCDWLIQAARPNLIAAGTLNPATGGRHQDSDRTNSEHFMTIRDWNLAMVFLQQRIADVVQLRFPGLENPTILHYGVGQEYMRHVDFLDPGSPNLAKQISQAGQRVITLLVYLNDDYQGGETDFPSIPWRYKGKKGGALFWWNVLPNGEPDHKTLHAGLPPTQGEKWVLSQWIRLPISSSPGAPV